MLTIWKPVAFGILIIASGTMMGCCSGGGCGLGGAAVQSAPVSAGHSCSSCSGASTGYSNPYDSGQVYSSAPTPAYSAPTQGYSAPAYSAPAQNYSVPSVQGAAGSATRSIGGGGFGGGGSGSR